MLKRKCYICEPMECYLNKLKNENNKYYHYSEEFYDIYCLLKVISRSEEMFSQNFMHRVIKSIYILKVKKTRILLCEKNNRIYLLYACSNKLNKKDMQIAMEYYQNI
ncbi:hypothetical protein B5F82_02065 [Megamonas hypermegale]|uniref:hypothetical protein n=1 Tax=Megamonas hypermegale TaxID=158847 RepID=UPI000B38AACD|nr:hypothetical protein [Megamonas hypermegale]OUO41174.1 hypothetical protein B5F82_02065 [Megamonas hypermegale]